MKKDVVIRISEANHKRLKKIMGEVAEVENRDKPPTINELMENLLDSMESVRHGKMLYIVDNIAFEDIALARGEAIVRAVAMKDIPVWPQVAVVIGLDHGN